MVYVKENVRISKLPLEVLEMLLVLSYRSAAEGRPVVITGKDDDVYRLDGAHQRGYALDIRADAKEAEDKLFFWKIEQDLKVKGLRVQLLFGDKQHQDHAHLHVVKGTESGN